MQIELTQIQRDLLRRFEGYYGEIPKSDYPSNQIEVDGKIKSLKQGLYMLVSDATITESQYAEAQGILTELSNTIH